MIVMAYSQSTLRQVEKEDQDVNTQVPRRHGTSTWHGIPPAVGSQSRGLTSVQGQVAPLILRLTEPVTRSVYGHLSQQMGD